MSQRSVEQQINLLNSKAARSLVAARRHIESGDYDFASSRTYYAAFYAIESLLLANNLSFSKHSAVIAAFNQYFIKTGAFPKQFSTYIARLFRQRQIGDYGVEMSIDLSDAVQDVQIAETIVNAIGVYLVGKDIAVNESPAKDDSEANESEDQS